MDGARARACAYFATREIGREVFSHESNSTTPSTSPAVFFGGHRLRRPRLRDFSPDRSENVKRLAGGEAEALRWPIVHVNAVVAANHVAVLR